MTCAVWRTWLALLTVVLLGLATACGGRAASAPNVGKVPVARTLFPDTIMPGEPFNVQPGGQSAIAVKAENVTNASGIVFNGTVLRTQLASDGILTALVPSDLVASSGALPVWITDGGIDSNQLTFTVKPR